MTYVFSVLYMYATSLIVSMLCFQLSSGIFEKFRTRCLVLRMSEPS
jgi:hypothetical protein